MSPSVQIIGVATVAFASTSMDSLGMLIALFAAREFRSQQVVAGYLGATLIVAAAAWAGSVLVEFVPASYLGLLGVIPLGLGIQRAWRLLHAQPHEAALLPAVGGAIVVGLVTFAQSVDNALVFISLFADTARELDALVFGTLAICAALWTAFAFWLAEHSPFRGTLQRVMRFVLPFLLIGVGVYILSDTVTDQFIR